MKKSIKVAVRVLLCVMLSALFAINASAAGNVTYNDGAKRFIFNPGSEYSPTDLFTDFKGVMPGDNITQKIFIDNDVDNGVKVILYVRALGETEGSDSNGFLEQLTLTVAVEDGEELFKAPADQPSGVDEWICLGTFYSGAAVTLDVTLDVPASMGNDFQDAIGFLDWEFKAEEFPPEPDDPKPPETGDKNKLVIFTGVSIVAIVAVVALIVVESKRRREQA